MELLKETGVRMESINGLSTINHKVRKQFQSYLKELKQMPKKENKIKKGLTLQTKIRTKFLE
ncbi:hypothetical protein LEP1GSC132_4505 [Leptospira kirschneri str. 200803703]|nr:hypothetical protein LEP1GSC132_4505 [Leptospira kirschneri str. 200803703]